MLLSGEDYKTYQRLIKKPSRDQNDWNVINKLLLNHELVYGITEVQKGGNPHADGTIVCLDRFLLAFTSFEAAEAGIQPLASAMEKKHQSVRLKTGTISYLGRFADRNGLVLVIDPEKSGKCVTYTRGRIEVSLIRPMGPMGRL